MSKSEMNRDLINRLRERRDRIESEQGDLEREAALEIERLYEENERLRGLILSVITGKWSFTVLREAIDE